MKSISVKVDQAEMMAAVLEKLLPCMQWDEEAERFFLDEKFFITMGMSDLVKLETLKTRIAVRLEVTKTL